MKLYNVFAIAMAPGIVVSQQLAPGTIFVPGNSPGSSETEWITAEPRETVIWSETFGNGIPATWENLGSPELAIWEYRGPLSVPDNNSGSRGSCLPAGMDFGAPIDSETREDGFVIFDSNYWDDDEGPCGSFGSGQAAAPHTASFTTPALDLSPYPFVGLAFHQYAKNYTANMKVQVSISGGVYQTVYTLPLATNAETERNSTARLNIGSLAGGQSDVRIRFLFEGNYYFWMIDDVKVLELDANDLVLSGATYGDFNPNNPDHTTGFEFMEYSIYPQSMLPLLKFSGRVDNLGGLPQENTALSVEVIQVGQPEILFSNTSEAIDLVPGAAEWLRTGQFAMPGAQGVYLIDFNVASDNEDDQPESNNAVRSVEIHPFTYARDMRALEAVYLPAEAQQNTAYEFGNIFLITAPDQHVASIACGVSMGTITGSTVYGKLYEFSFQGGLITANLVGVTQEVQVSASDLNGPGEENMMVMPFTNEIALTEGRAYAVMAHAEMGAPSVLSGMSGNTPPFTSWVHFPANNSWFFLSKTPMVRMYLDNGNSLVEPEPLSVHIYPNPASEWLTLATAEQGSYWLYDAAGKMILAGSKGAGAEVLNIREIAEGLYFLVFRQSNGIQITEKVLLKSPR
jgi:hypothetical protein